MTEIFAMNRSARGESAAGSKYYETAWGTRSMLVAITRDFYEFLASGLGEAELLNLCERMARDKAEKGKIETGGLIYLSMKDL